MSPRRRKVVGVLIGLLILPMAVAGVWAWCLFAYVKPYERVRLGDTESHVLAILGKPDKITGPPENVAAGDDTILRVNQGECVRVFWYIPPIAVEEYTVGFDSSARVVSKYRYSSP
jgi:hypothetical protein